MPCGGEAGPLYFSPIYSSEHSVQLVSPATATRGMLRSLQHFTNEFEEHRIKKYVQNITMLKCAKDHENWLRHFEDISKICEPLGPTLYILHFTCKLL